MREDIIYKLKTLQSIEPEEALKAGRKRKLMEKISVFGVRNDIFLSSSDIYTTKNKFALGSIFSNRLATSLASIAVVFASGIWTVDAAQSSLPGDTLYSVKKAGEEISLAIASEQDKPKVEIALAGKRLEELAEISQKTSDSNQQQKVEMLVEEFNEKVASANERLSQLNEKGKTDDKVKVASAAKIVNEQSEKYSEVLQKTAQNLPDVVKDKVAAKVADAATATEKVNLSSLMVMVESKEPQNTEEIVAKVQKTIEKAEVKVSALSVQTAASALSQFEACETANSNETETAASEICSAQDKTSESSVMTEEAIRKLEEAKESLKNSNLTDTLKSVSQATEIAAQVVPDPVAPVVQVVAQPVQPVQTESAPVEVLSKPE